MVENKNRELDIMVYGICIIFFIYWYGSMIIKSYYSFTQDSSIILAIVLLYIIGIPILLKITNKIPNTKIHKKSINPKLFIILFTLQFTAFFLVSISSNIIQGLLGTNIEINNNLNSITPLMIIHLLIISPIVEEYIFRKLFADKLLKYGELFYILTSSFCFSLVHLVPIGFSHVLYTFILGLIWSFAYIKTGNILVPIILHSLSNIF